MSIRLRVKDCGIGLCTRCENSTVSKGRNAHGGSFTRIICNVGMRPLHITGIVDECSDFREHGRLTLNDMKATAWILLQDPKKNMGFVHPSKIPHRELETILDGIKGVG